MLAAVLAGLVVSLVAPAVRRVAGQATGWVLAILPLGLTAYFAARAGRVAAGEVLAVAYPWVPGLGITLSLRLDGLSLLFALLIAGVGTVVLAYAGGYLGDHPQLGRFYAYLLGFMASMLGVVLADNVLTLFVFWELTSLASYLLIGFEHERAAARAAALQALLVTGLGGLALLAGLLLLGQAGGGLELSTLLARGDTVRAHALYPAILVLVLLGAFTKSAQVPFHFWLPGAMEAPTPVSAYLHSATMVKAGVYLLARLSPVLGGTGAWYAVVVPAGALTMLVGAVLAARQDDLKRTLAYTTVSALGVLTLLLGLGTPLALEAAMTFLLAHALYKGALFLVAGAVEHEAGTREVERLGGLRGAMPVTATAAGLAALSMVGVPPFLGFVGKELVYEATQGAPAGALLLTAVAVAANACYAAAAGLVGLKPFLGRRADPATPVHEAPASLWLGPALLGALGLLTGLLPGLAASVVTPAVSAVAGRPATVTLALWHGVNLTLLLSAVTTAGAVGVYLGRASLRRAARALGPVARLGPARGYQATLAGVNAVARLQTRLLQSGYLRRYVLTVVGATVAAAGTALWRVEDLALPADPTGVPFYEAGLAGAILLAAAVAAASRSRYVAVTALGVLGYAMALVFVRFGAPDLAITQVLVDTLTVVLFVLVFYHLPQFARLSREPARIRDVLVALAAGGLVTGLMLATPPAHETIWRYYAEQSVPAGHGRNIVNVILVDFRALDTLGEIAVLALAAVGVYTLLQLRASREPRR